MDFNIPTVPSANVQRALDNVVNNRQIQVDASKIQLGSTAKCVATLLHSQILDYQNSLPETDDVALKVVQFNQSTTIIVDDIGYIGYNLVCFYGKDSSGKPLELIQHIHQLNFLLTVCPKPTPDEPKRKIGFRGQEE